MNEEGRYETIVRNRLKELTRVNAEVRAFLAGHAISAEAAYALELAIEELLTNVIRHGLDDTVEHDIRLDVCLLPDELVMTIQDRGRAFDPVAAPVPDTSIRPEERAEGGLGVHLVRELAERMAYRRVEDRNISAVHIRR